jgi:hypothetical protein
VVFFQPCLVGEEVEVEAVLLEDVLEEGDDLQREDVLATVVTHLRSVQYGLEQL